MIVSPGSKPVWGTHGQWLFSTGGFKIHRAHSYPTPTFTASLFFINHCVLVWAQSEAGQYIRISKGKRPQRYPTQETPVVKLGTETGRMKSPNWVCFKQTFLCQRVTGAFNPARKWRSQCNTENMHFRVTPLSATYPLYSKHAFPMLHFLHLVTYPLNCWSVTYKKQTKKQTSTSPQED